MPKTEWGVKRTCPNCEERFYDLQKEPIVCPECGTTYDVDAHGKVSATREKRVPAPVKVAEDDLVDDGDVDDDEEDDADEALLGDDEDDEEPASPTLSDEEDETEAAPFKDASLVDDDDDEDEDDDVDIDDDDDDADDIDLDDVAGKDKP